MKTIQSSGPTEIITIGLGPGEMLLESIQQAIKEYDIRNGVVISGIGTMKVTKMHFVDNFEFPPKNVFYEVKKPFELTSIDGLIVDGDPHLHISGMVRNQEAYAGHLEPESEVLYLAEIAILKCNDLNMVRNQDAERSLSLLGPKK